MIQHLIDMELDYINVLGTHVNPSLYFAKYIVVGRIFFVIDPLSMILLSHIHGD